jgi:hypothetical protein
VATSFNIPCFSLYLSAGLIICILIFEIDCFWGMYLCICLIYSRSFISENISNAMPIPSFYFGVFTTSSGYLLPRHRLIYCLGVFTAVCFFVMVLSTKGYSQRDTCYIVPNNSSFSVRGSIFGNILDLSIDEPSIKKELSYNANAPAHIGLGISHRKLPFEVSYAHSIGGDGENKHIQTNSFDFQLHRYGQKVLADFFIQRYKGL